MTLEEKREKLLCSKLLWTAGPPPLAEPLTREDRDGTPNGTKVVQFLTFVHLAVLPPDGWKREAFAIQ